MKLLLASRSSARRQMLEAAGVPFESVEAPLDEEEAKRDLQGLAAEPLAMKLAELKALSVARDDAMVLGADQTLELDDGRTLGKSGSIAEAREQLRRMNGATHKLHSAAVIAEGGEVVWSCAETVTMGMRPLSDDFITSYLDEEFDQIRWSVGCYRIEGPGVQLFERIEGSHFAILGLPLLPLLGFLRVRGVLAS